MRDATFRWTPVCGSCSTAFAMRIVMVHSMCMLWSTESIILVVYVVCTCTQSATCVLLVYVVCICTQSQTCIVQCQWHDVTLQRHAPPHGHQFTCNPIRLGGIVARIHVYDVQTTS